MRGADSAQQILLLHRAHDVDERDTLGNADLLQHLAEIGGGGGLDNRLVPLAPCRFDAAERRQRIDEHRRAPDRAGPFWQRHHVARP